MLNQWFVTGAFDSSNEADKGSGSAFHPMRYSWVERGWNLDHLLSRCGRSDRYNI